MNEKVGSRVYSPRLQIEGVYRVETDFGFLLSSFLPFRTVPDQTLNRPGPLSSVTVGSLPLIPDRLLILQLNRRQA